MNIWDHNHVGGYEWYYHCGECSTQIGMEGWGSFGTKPIVNGEEHHKGPPLKDGDTIECPKCGDVRTVRFEKSTSDSTKEM